MFENLTQTKPEKKFRSRTEIRDAKRDVQRRRESLIENSLESQLEKLRQEDLRLNEEDAATRQEISRIKSASQATEREKSLWEQIREAMEKENRLVSQYHLSNRDICPDGGLAAAVEKIDAAKSELEKLLQPFRERPNVSPGARISARISELEKTISAFDRGTAQAPSPRKICELGRKVHEIREQIKSVSAERDELKKAREEAALQAAGLAD